MADPDAVPAGRYGRQALVSLGVWPQVAPKIVRAENVRAALALVQRAEARAGIVYATDARATKGVAVAGMFPAASHSRTANRSGTPAPSATRTPNGSGTFFCCLRAKAVLRDMDSAGSEHLASDS